MVRKCVVCSAPQRKNSMYSFHPFPKREDRRRAWALACGIDKSMVTDLTLVCSKHFKIDDFDIAMWPRNKLLTTAVPSPSADYQKKTETTKSELMALDEATCNTKDFTECALTSHAIAGSRSQYKVVHEIIETQIESLHTQSIVTMYQGAVSPPRTVRYVGDLTPKHFSSPQKAKRHLQFVKEEMMKQQKRIKRLSTQKKRLEQKIDSMAKLLKHLKDKELLSEEASNTIMESTPSILQDILRRQLVSKNRKYDPGVRAFALTLHFYSAMAYNYVRKQFNYLLPHPETIRKWYLVIEGEPGFTKESFDAVKLKVNEESNTVVVNVVMDEMAIRQFVEWDGKKYHGYVDLGSGLEGDGDELQEAKQALVFMAVCMNGSWKIPLGYFLIASLNGSERANLLITCLELLYETGVKCNSVTFDGAPVNISMATSLGCNFKYGDNFKPWFAHHNTKERVHILFDACHMLKLVRNTLGEKLILVDPNCKKIEWKYIVQLHELEEDEGLRAGTKLTARHINFQNEKMKVKLATQTLSLSVSAAMKLCVELGISQFQNSEASAEFCYNMNNAFDILNSRNLCAKYLYRRGVSSENYTQIKVEIDRIIKYISELRDESGRLILETNRKTGFLGLIISLSNYLHLYEDFIMTKYLKFMLAYKLSQDHLETFFGAIRQRGGHNNNPSALQYKSAYKKLLVRHQITASQSGNCSILDATTILHVGAGTRCKTSDNIVSLPDTDDIIITNNDHDYFGVYFSFSPFLEIVLSYISGFIVKRITPFINCNICKEQLYGTECSPLIKLKSWGSLVTPSIYVIKICKRLETIFRCSTFYFNKKNAEGYLLIQVLKDTSDLFDNDIMNNHIIDQDIIDNHKIQLIKLISKFYLKLRFHHHAAVVSDALHKNRIRHKYTKLILFHNE